MHRPAPLAAALVAVAALLTVAAPAPAAGPVVQERQPGPRLIAHRYEAPTASSQTLKVAFAPGATRDSVTAFDFDRDGRRDAAVYIDGANGVAFMYDLRSTAAPGSCLAFSYAQQVGSFVALTTSVGTNRTVVTVALPAAWRTTFGDIVRYQPEILTIAGDNLGGSSDADTAARDYLPDSAGPVPNSTGSNTTCNDSPTGFGGRAGQLHTMSQGTDRGQGDGPAASRQPMVDLPTGDPGDADLLGVAIERWDAAGRPNGDATADAAPATGSTQPTDLLLTFAPGSPLESATYLTVGGATQLVRTRERDATTVDVDLYDGIAAAPAGCFAKDPAPTATSRTSLVLPATATGGGVRTVRVALDTLVGVYEGAATGPLSPFRWATAGLDAGISDPVPDLAPSGAQCDSAASAGASDGVPIDASRQVQFSATLPAATLTVPPATRGTPVTLTASGGTQFRFDAGATGTFDGPNGTATRQATYGQPTRARVIVRDAGGNDQMAVADVAPQNAAPQSALSPRPATVALGCRAAEGGTASPTFSSAGSSDPDGGTISGRTWSISGPAGFRAGGTGATFTPTLPATGSYTVTLAVTDNEGATDPTPDSLTFTVVDSTQPCVTRARLERVDPAGAAPVFAGRPVTFSAGSSTVSSPPARYAFDLDGDGSFETDTGAEPTATTTYAGAGGRTVRVRVRAGGGQEDVAALAVDVLAAPDLAPTVVLSAPDVLTLANGAATATLDATGSTGRNLDRSLTFTWDTDGDGTFDRATGADPVTRVTFATRGARTLRVRATDVYGNVATASREVLVRDAVDEQFGCTAREAYRTVSFGPARGAACWTRIDRPSAGPLWIATGRLNLNGLVLGGAEGSTAVDRTFPDCAGACAQANALFNDGRQGAAIALDPYAGKLVSNAPIAVRAEGSDVNLPLSVGPVDWTLPYSPREDGFVVRVPKGGLLFGLPVDGEAEVRFPAPGATSVRLNVKMPAGLPGVSGAATVQATPSQGVVVDRLKVDVGTGLLGSKLLLRELGFEYDRSQALWAGSAKVRIPAPRPFDLGVAVAVQNGRFKRIAGEVDNLNQPLGKGIFLQRIAAGVAVEPLDLTAGVGLSAGPRVRDFALLRLDGDLRLRFPSEAAPYTLFQLTGEATIARALPLADAFVQFTDGGFVEARGGIGGDYSIGYFRASVGGWLTESAANFDGDAEVGLLVDGRRVALLGAKGVVSTVGVAACGEIPVINVGGGLGAKWSDMKLASFRGCDLGPYRVARPADAPPAPFAARAAQAPPRRGHALRLPAGLRAVALEVVGRGGVPRFQVLDARGRTALDATAEALDERRLVLQNRERSTATVLWKAPRAGRYVVVAAPGSPPVTSVRSALDAGPPRIDVSVRGRGERRTLRWSVRPSLQRGQRLVLAEQARGAGGRPLLDTARSRGAVAFRPAAGPAGTRTVRATLLSDGFGSEPRTVARFTAPRPVAPGRPAGVRLVRRGRVVRATWSAPRGGRPRAYRVAWRTGADRRVLREVAGGVRSARLADVPAAQAVRVTVTGVGATEALAGPAAPARLAAGALDTRRGAGGARPRALRVRRSGRSVVVRWRPGRERVRGFAVVVRGGGRRVVVEAHAGRRAAVVRGVPRGRLTVEVGALRFDGATAVARRALPARR